MSELLDLYGELIKDHKSRPRNFKVLAGANRQVAGVNPLCGDKFTISLFVDDGIVRDVGFQGNGCAISTASASMMTEAVKGKSVSDAHRIFHGFHDLIMGKADDDGASLGKLAAFAGVRAFPMRVKCATLAWHALESALNGVDTPVSTELPGEHITRPAGA
jgi:nitrogen fixation NifU-like protein